MSGGSDNLVLEHLRAMRRDIAAIKGDMCVMRAEMLIMRQHMAGILSAQVLHDQEMAVSRFGSTESNGGWNS